MLWRKPGLSSKSCSSPTAISTIAGRRACWRRNGRTDFPRGNHQELIDSITKKLWPLGDDVTFIPGHGPTSQFGYERKVNAYVSDYALS